MPSVERPTAPPDAASPADSSEATASAGGQGRGPFELAGRAAPGLYLAAWGLVVGGLGAVLVALAAGHAAGAMVAFVVGLAACGLGLAAAAGSQALQRRADGAIYAGPSPVLVFAAAVVLTLVAGFALAALEVVSGGPILDLASSLISGTIALGLVALVVVGSNALGWREMGLRLPARGEGSPVVDALWGITLAVPALAGTLLLTSILVAFVGVAPEPPLSPARDPAGVAVNLLVAALIAPVWEEVFFRGFVTTAWARSAGPRTAIVRGAVFFALAHLITLSGGDFGTALRAALVAFAMRLPVGLVLGWAFLRRGTLVAPIALHATYNAITVFLVAVGAAASPG